MEITEEKFKKLCKIAKLNITQNTKDLKKDLGAISTWIDKINEIDISNIEPILSMSKETNNLRSDDKVSEALKHSEVLKNAPESDSNYFRIFPYVNEEN